MKRMFTNGILSSVFVLLTIGVAMGQSRHHDHRNHHKEDRHANAHRIENSHGKHVHRHAHRAWAKYHHHNPRLRYAYFRDYNVYYDYSRQAYLAFDGKRWIISVEIPLAMRRAEFRTMHVADIDYRGDDIHEFHGRRMRILTR